MATALALRIGGASHSAISRHLTESGYRCSTLEAATLIVEALREAEALTDREAAMLRTLELMRMDRIISALSTRLHGPRPEDPKAAAQHERLVPRWSSELRALVELRCRVAGLDLGAAVGVGSTSGPSVQLNVMFQLGGAARELDGEGLRSFVRKALAGDAETIEAARQIGSGTDLPAVEPLGDVDGLAE